MRDPEHVRHTLGAVLLCLIYGRRCIQIDKGTTRGENCVCRFGRLLVADRIVDELDGLGCDATDRSNEVGVAVDDMRRPERLK